jgi:hypothetical protein
MRTKKFMQNINQKKSDHLGDRAKASRPLWIEDEGKDNINIDLRGI